MQAAAAYAAIANDGVRVSPHLIREIREENGAVVFQAKPESHRVVSAETAGKMREMLSAVTEDGTGKRAQLDGYTSAGKTGTARKYDVERRSYASGKYVGSFVGFAPAEAPAVVIAVMIDEPAGAYYGGDVAAPIFRDIAEQVLPELNIVPAKPDVLLAKNERQVEPEKISLTLKAQNNGDEKSIDSPKTNEKSPSVGNQKTSEKIAPKSEVARDGEKVKTEKQSKSEKALPNEPRPRLIEKKVAEKKPETKKPEDKKPPGQATKTLTATNGKTKNEQSPKKTENTANKRKT